MIQLILARTVSSLCNCVTYFSGNTRSTGPNFHYRGFNKTRNDQTEYEIDSLLMEDDLVDELVATPLSAEEIAAKLSNSNTKNNPNNLLGGRDVNIDGSNIGARGADIWMGGGGSSMGIGGGRMKRNENKISNDWWSDGEEEEEEEEVEVVGGGFGNGHLHNFSVSGDRGGGVVANSNQMTEKMMNTALFNSNPVVAGNNTEDNVEGDLYFDENIADLSFQGNDSNNNQLQNDNWDKEFLDNYKDEESFDFVAIGTDLKMDQIDKDRISNDEIIFGNQNDLIEYRDFNKYNNNNNSLPPVIGNKDPGDFTSGSFPNNNYIINNNDYDTTDNYYESKMGITTLKNSQHFFNQENDEINLKKTCDYQNNQLNHKDQQNRITEVGNAIDDFCNYNSPEKEDDGEEFAYSNNNHHEISSSNQFGFDDFIDVNKNVVNDSITHIGQESGFGMESENILIPSPESSVQVRGNLLDDFDDIFNSSSASNDIFGGNRNNNNNNNNSITSTFDYEEKNFQTSNYGVSTYEDDEFGMFDFVSAKSPPANNDFFKPDFLLPDGNSSNNNNNQRTSILLE
ncbi:uncharacterized protein ELE39_001863 [Cryptosporidium sp. chipmunk genotype I]|uniref:uncharacterized protein n=1 Tax=Cryptosporidium sp. chipmunk genotype I TaxID=1280935 RepID=UPI00351A3A71|nr:hypothetical protein ELE39_001863 [Cryptosporidium sp. chipmunk genotype I]